MIFTQWNFEDAKAVWLEEGREEGAERKQDEVIALIEQGLSAAEIKERLSQKSATERP